MDGRARGALTRQGLDYNEETLNTTHDSIEDRQNEPGITFSDTISTAAIVANVQGAAMHGPVTGFQLGPENEVITMLPVRMNSTINPESNDPYYARAPHESTIDGPQFYQNRTFETLSTVNTSECLFTDEMDLN